MEATVEELIPCSGAPCWGRVAPVFFCGTCFVGLLHDSGPVDLRQWTLGGGRTAVSGVGRRCWGHFRFVFIPIRTHSDTHRHGERPWGARVTSPDPGAKKGSSPYVLAFFRALV